MRRAPFVIAGTAVGLAAVLGFHTRQAPVSVAITGGSSTSTVAGTSTSTAPATTTTQPATTTTVGGTGTTSPAATTSTAPATTTTQPASTRRQATGASVDYSYGVLSVEVTAVGKKITDVTIASLDDGGDFRSQSIDQESIPILEQEALQAQGASIQSVSGATYTSEGFVQSLQSALGKLGLA